MNIYLLEQDTNNDYDTYDSCIVASESKGSAQHILPDKEYMSWDKDTGMCWGWANSIDDVNVTFIGTTNLHEEGEVLCFSFNAG